MQCDVVMCVMDKLGSVSGLEEMATVTERCATIPPFVTQGKSPPTLQCKSGRRFVFSNSSSVASYQSRPFLLWRRFSDPGFPPLLSGISHIVHLCFTRLCVFSPQLPYYRLSDIPTAVLTLPCLPQSHPSSPSLSTTSSQLLFLSCLSPRVFHWKSSSFSPRILPDLLCVSSIMFSKPLFDLLLLLEHFFL